MDKNQKDMESIGDDFEEVLSTLIQNPNTAKDTKNKKTENDKS